MAEDRPDILFMPPVGVAVALVVTFVLGRWLPLGLLPPFPWLPAVVAGALLCVAAAATSLAGLRAFRRAGTNVIPTRPALSVVSDGIYRHTRNPMYLGMVMLVLGAGILSSNLWGVIVAALLWLALDRGVVRREEAYLEAKFGDTYRALLAGTRRWL